MVGVESICCWDWDACGIWAALAVCLLERGSVLGCHVNVGSCAQFVVITASSTPAASEQRLESLVAPLHRSIVLESPRRIFQPGPLCLQARPANEQEPRGGGSLSMGARTNPC